MRFDKSRELFERAKKSIAGGVNSDVRLKETPNPLYIDHGKGSRLYDVDGNEYIDHVLGQGPQIFGHSPDFLLDAVSRKMHDGQVFAASHELEINISETIQKLVPSAELIRYSSSGTEAVQAALRIARAYTKKTKYIKFEGQYHGWVDSVLYSSDPELEEAGAYESPNSVPGSDGMVPSTANEIIILPWNNIDVLRETVNRLSSEIAAIITEPIMHNTNCIYPKPGYLEAMRELCSNNEIVLILDEVVTGFRLGLGGAQELLGITPDLSTFAKAMAGGFPLSMVVGKSEIMNVIANRSTNHSGTMNTNIVSMAAAEASINKLMENDGAAYKHIHSLGTALMEGLRDRAKKHEINTLIQGTGYSFCMAFTDVPEIVDFRSHMKHTDAEMYQKFRVGMLERGVRVTPRGMWYISTAHTEQDVEAVLKAADETLSTL